MRVYIFVCVCLRACLHACVYVCACARMCVISFLLCAFLYFFPLFFLLITIPTLRLPPSSSCCWALPGRRNNVHDHRIIIPSRSSDPHSINTLTLKGYQHLGHQGIRMRVVDLSPQLLLILMALDTQSATTISA